MSRAQAFPTCILTILAYAGALAVVSVLIVELRLPDTLLFAFLIPCLLTALFFKRHLYLSMQILLAGAAAWVTSRVSADPQTSLINVLALWICSVVIAEGIHALVVQRRQAEEALRQRTDQLEALQEISTAITAQLDLDDLLHEVAEQACRLLHAQGASLHLLDPTTGELRQAVSYGYAKDHTTSRPAPGEGGSTPLTLATRLTLATPLTLATSLTLAERVLESGQPMRVDDREDGAITEALCVPLKGGGELMGTLRFDRVAVSPPHGATASDLASPPAEEGGSATQTGSAPGGFDDQDERLATLFASHAAFAIENARLYDETSQQAGELSVLYDVISAAATAVHIDQVLERTVETLERTLQPDTIAILLLEPKTNELVIRAWSGFPDGPTLMRRPVGVGIPGSVAKTGEAILLADVRQDGRYHSCDPRTRSELCVPLTLNEQVIGALNLESHRIGAFNEDHLRLTSTLARHLVAVIENAQLYEQARQEVAERKRVEEALRDRERFLALLNDVTRAALETSDLSTMLQTVAARLGTLFGADGCYLTLWDEEAGRTRPMVCYGRGTGSGAVDGAERERYRSLTPNPDEETVTASVLRAGAPIAIEDVSDTPHLSPRMAERLPDRSLLGLPLIAGDEKLGAALISYHEPHRFTPEEIARGEQAAGQVALAVAKARLVAELRGYTDELETHVAERTAQIREQFAQMEALLDSVADGIVVTSAGGDGEPDDSAIVLANPVAHTWIHQTLAPEEAEELRATIQTMTDRAAERPVELLELTGLDLELRATPIAGLEGQEAQAVVAIHDVTHLRAMDRMKTRFITDISHELKTPVATIKLLAHLLGKEEEDWREHWRLLTEETERLAGLVEGILEIARVDAGRTELKVRPIELNDVTDHLVASHETLSHDRGLEMTYRPSPNNPVVTADPRYITRALRNLMSNALLYTPEGGQIEIAVDETTGGPASAPGDRVDPGDCVDPGDRVDPGAASSTEALDGAARGRRWARVTVSDTGWGIPEEEQAHVFERFFRGEKPRAMQISGTGLGLALAKDIVELHGGRITMESRDGDGSAFTIWLPTSPAVTGQRAG